MTRPAKFRNKRLAVTGRILRLRRGAGGQRGGQYKDRPQKFHL
jgi:hypothetical protein